MKDQPLLESPKVKPWVLTIDMIKVEGRTRKKLEDTWGVRGHNLNNYHVYSLSMLRLSDIHFSM